MTIWRSIVLLGIVGCSLLSTGCGSNDNDDDVNGSNSSGSDVYSDSTEVPPPPVSDPTISASGSLAPKGEDDLVEINVAGFAAPTSADESRYYTAASTYKARSTKAASTIEELTADDFVVVEDGVVKGITVERISSERRAAADILFIVDTTGSMGAALDSVQDSIIKFADFLDTNGLDVRLGAVTAGDAYDTKKADSDRTGTSLQGNEPPPGLDGRERPTFPLTTDLDAFKSFINEDSPRAGNDSPENTLGALDFGYENIEWREGAQKIAIVITDMCSHNKSTFELEFGTGDDVSNWTPPQTNELLTRLKGNATVHVVAPAEPGCSDDAEGNIHTNMADMTGVDGTGGVFYNWDGTLFDLSELALAEASAGGYIVTYRGTFDGVEKEIRVVIDNGDEIRGEFTITAIY